MNLTVRKLINTVQIHGMEEDDNEFPIPFLVGNGYYFVPVTNGAKEGVPKVLNLRDLTGEGTAGQFALFEYEACAISNTSALGYSPKLDKAVQFRIETASERGKPEITYWVEEVFERKPVRPGRWDFLWYPGHGADGPIHERLSFNRARQLFVKH